MEPLAFLGYNQLQDTGWKGFTIMGSGALNLASLTTWITYVISERPAVPLPPPPLATLLDDSGITGFFPDRDHYRLRGDGLRSISSYINSAVVNLTMVSVSFVTARDYEGTLDLLRDKLNKRTDGFRLCISLLNPEKLYLLDALSENFSKSRDQLRTEIRNGLKELLAFRQSLSPEAQARCEIRTHNSIPFASAIIIDEATRSAKIQLETKSYKASYNKSIALEVVPTRSGNDVYHTLLTSYHHLLEDGQSVIN